MLSLGEGQANNRYLLSCFIVDENGKLQDPDTSTSFTFKIDNLTGGFPVALEAAVTQSQTTGSGKFAKGYFYAWQDGQPAAWTAPPGTTTGLYRITWTYTLNSEVRELVRHFHLVPASEGFERPFVLSTFDLTTAGISTVTTVQGKHRLIREVEAAINRVTNQWFHPIYETARYRGRNHETLFLGIPILGVQDIIANQSRASNASTRVVVDRDLYHVHSWPHFRDAKANPFIELIGTTTSDFFAARLVIGEGFDNAFVQDVSGVFGCVGEDGHDGYWDPPSLLIDVARDAALAMAGEASLATTSLKYEKTDMHEYEYQAISASASSAMVLSSATQMFNGDTSISSRLAFFKSPIKLGAPVEWSSRQASP